MSGLRDAVAALSRSQLVLRALILLGPVLAVLAAGPAGRWPPWWVALGVVILSGAFAVRPGSPVGAWAMIAVLAWWVRVLDDGLHPMILVAATGLLVAHVAAVLADYGPEQMPVEAALVRLWVRRGLTLLLAVPLVWALSVALRGEPERPGIWVIGVSAGLVAVVAATVALTASPPEEDPS